MVPKRRRPMDRGRLRRHELGGTRAADEFVEIEPGELTGIFAAPGWLRDLGIFSPGWWSGWQRRSRARSGSLSLTQTIVVPVITAAIIASVHSPVVDWLGRGGVPRADAAAAIVFVAILARAVSASADRPDRIAGQAQQLEREPAGPASKMHRAGSRTRASTPAQAERTRSMARAPRVSGGVQGPAPRVFADRRSRALASLAVFLTFTALSLFFLLKDAPTHRRLRAERHMGVPSPVGRTVTGADAGALRGYFAGVTIVAAFSAIVVGVGALVLGWPCRDRSRVVTFVGGLCPVPGRLVGRGVHSPDRARELRARRRPSRSRSMVLLANGALQQMVQPVAYGATLGIHPLAVLIVTIAGGALFGTIGLVLAAPLTAAAVKISADLARARAKENETPEESPPPGAPPEARPAPSSG